MREIKFRVWDNETNHMIYPEKTFDPGHHSFSMHSGSLQYYNLQNGYGTGEIMQYTGLKDKNGVEIYEGDVVKFSMVIPTPVVYSDEAAGFVIANIAPTQMLARYVHTYGTPEVIGNIHQPE